MAEVNMATVLKRMRKTGAVYCEGCHKVIYEMEKPETLGYSKTKRGTEIVIHRKCMDKVWKTKITGRKEQ